MKKKHAPRAQALVRRDDVRLPAGRPRPISTLTREQLNEALATTARRLVALFEERFSIQYVDSIYIEHAWIGARYSDGSSGALLQYRPDRRMGE